MMKRYRFFGILVAMECGKNGDWIRACFKIAFCQMCVPICGRFDPNEGGVVGYVDRMRTKYTAKWGV